MGIATSSAAVTREGRGRSEGREVVNRSPRRWWQRSHRPWDAREVVWSTHSWGQAEDQPPGALDLDAMGRDTLTSLEALAEIRAHVRLGVPAPSRPRLQTLEPLIRATLDPREAYNDVPGANPQNR